VEAIEAAARAARKPVPLLLDLSADYRCDASGAWAYGLPERPGARAALARARRIANPGCYATGAQAALLPFLGAGAGARFELAAHPACRVAPALRLRRFLPWGCFGAALRPMCLTFKRCWMCLQSIWDCCCLPRRWRR
jgi:hypothetical protein